MFVCPYSRTGKGHMSAIAGAVVGMFAFLQQHYPMKK